MDEGATRHEESREERGFPQEETMFEIKLEVEIKNEVELETKEVEIKSKGDIKV